MFIRRLGDMPVLGDPEVPLLRRLRREIFRNHSRQPTQRWGYWRHALTEQENREWLNEPHTEDQATSQRQPRHVYSEEKTGEVSVEATADASMWFTGKS